jgi:hypothetical protein
VNGGGNALVLRQKNPGSWLPVPVAVKDGAAGFNTNLYAVGYSVTAGLLPEDFMAWGQSGLVYGMAYEPPKFGAVRVLTGQTPINATLLEARYGSGRFLLNTLELTARKAAQEPVAAKLLANVVSTAKTTKPQAMVQPVALQSAPADKTLVISGFAGERTEALKDRLRLQADFATQVPDSLAGYSLVVFTDFNSPQAKIPAAAPQLRGWVEAGGNLLVEEVSPALQTWLQGALNLNFSRRKMSGARAYKTAHDPLLVGISDGDMAWGGNTGEWAFTNRGEGAHDIIREEVVPEGAQVLTFPAVLVKKTLGKGQLVIDQSRWVEVTNKGAEGWGYDSKIIATRYKAALLTNLGAYLGYPAVADNLLVGLAYEPLDLTPALNRSRVDEKPNDGKGWIDLGERFDLRAFPSGQQRLGDVLFNIVDESKTGGNGAIMLRGAEALASQPEQSAIIPVGKKAKSLFFLQTSAYLGSKRGTVAGNTRSATKALAS